MSKSKIEWTDETWNVSAGCTKLSLGCRACYAESMHKRLTAMGIKKYSQPFSEVVCHESELERSFPGRGKKIFVNSMSDLFHEDVPFQFIDKVFIKIYETSQHTFLILTKRADRMLEYLSIRSRKIIIENVWLGVSVEDQKTADERIPLLLQTPAAVRFLSIEPMLDYINLTNTLLHEPWLQEKIDWVIIGCESGLKKRECKIEWVRNIVDQCRSVGFEKIFIKQLNINGKVVKDIEQFPEDLRIREYPNE